MTDAAELLARENDAEMARLTGIIFDLVKALEQIIQIDQHEKRTAVEIDPAGNTYNVELLDGTLARIARAALGAVSGVKHD